MRQEQVGYTSSTEIMFHTMVQLDLSLTPTAEQQMLQLHFLGFQYTPAIHNAALN
jgi:hypothetical protein